ncbi:pyrroline-5-carboxylate reductase 3-like [Onthophagus taurus]|uniref:pyrroline-5-carboxylate reductase 3-like n=1 Tax=Onthophagus taurus TaxID=166361 RepID=UPI000C208D36|nr:pyrroline-5-carboxylate reductase 3-like [Onthophagus taurus]
MGDSLNNLAVFKTMKIGFIGGGNMARAIAEGIVQKGLAPYSSMYVSGPHEENLKEWKTKGVQITTENGVVVEKSSLIFLAVKPHILPAAIANVYDTISDWELTDNKLFVSVLAGVKLEALESILTRLEGSRVIRVMPNTPMMVGAGCSVYCPGQHATDHDSFVVKTILEVSGLCQLVPESMIDAVGALTGCGPAFIYLIIEAMSDGAVMMGVPRNMATNFAAQTVLGAAKMVQQTGKSTGVLKEEVCSPGGTTITGIHALESGGVRAAIMNAIEASTKKSEELGRK